MDPNIFRKQDAKSILEVSIPWKQIEDRPTMFDELADRVQAMHDAAKAYHDSNGLTRQDTLMRLKEAIRDVLIYPLTFKWEGDTYEPDADLDKKGLVGIDAVWDEIPGVPEELKEALQDAYLMYHSITEKHKGEYLTDKSTLMDAKEIMNETVLKPMLGIEEDD